MNITINGNDIDFTLEKESSAGEVLDGVASWLEKSGMLVAGMAVNGEKMVIADADWRNRDIRDIERIDFEAVSLREGRIRQLETGRDYFLLLNQAASGGDNDSLADLGEGFADIMRILPHLLGESGTSGITPVLGKNLNEAGFPPNGDAAADANLAAIRSESEKAALLLENRRKETADPEGEALSAARALVAIAERLEDVAVNLQTGRDREAMDTIIILTEMLQTLMRSLSWLGEVKDVQGLADDLTGILGELEGALKASDTVLIGDLLEYEIKPRLQELPGRLGFGEEAVS